MIFDDMASIMSAYSMRELRRKTGLRKGRLASLRCGCTFNLDYDLIHALDSLGYEVKISPKKVGKSQVNC